MSDTDELHAAAEAACDQAYAPYGRFTVSVALDVKLPEITDADTAVAIVAAAHGICPYSNATRGNIDVVLTANGHAVEPAARSLSGV